FSVTPHQFCTVPQAVHIEWTADGEEHTVSLGATPTTAELPGPERTPEGLTGSLSTSVGDSTTFELAAGTLTQRQTVTRVSGESTVTLTCTAACIGGELFCEADASPDDSGPGILVHSVRNTGAQRMQVAGSGSARQTLEPHES